MGLRKTICMLAVCMMILGSFVLSVNAAETADASGSKINVRSTGAFNMNVPANSYVSADTSIYLIGGDLFRITASYAPASASVDFGLVDEDGEFYYINVTNGSIDKTIQIQESGNYTFQVRNNANYEISVSGYVNY